MSKMHCDRSLNAWIEFVELLLDATTHNEIMNGTFINQHAFEKSQSYLNENIFFVSNISIRNVARSICINILFCWLCSRARARGKCFADATTPKYWFLNKSKKNRETNFLLHLIDWIYPVFSHSYTLRHGTLYKMQSEHYFIFSRPLS